MSEPLISESDCTFRIVLLGNLGVGKSSLISRFTDNVFDEDQLSTVAVDYKLKQIQVDNTFMRIQVWDTAGSEKFRSIARSYYRGCQGFMIVYDITNEESFKDIEIWLLEIEKYGDGQLDRPILIIGNKSDMEEKRKVSFEDAQKKYSNRSNFRLTEASARTNYNVQALFVEISQQYLNVMAGRLPQKKKSTKTFSMNSTQKKKKSFKCCK